MEDTHSPKILILDDHETILRAWTDILVYAGFRVATAENGRSAIRLLQEDETIAAALLDYRLPDMTGLDVLNWIREEHAKPSLPVVVSTASIANGRRCLEEGGADFFFAKPVNTHALLASLNQVTGLSETT